MEFCTDLSAADWLVESQLDWTRLVGFGPAGFEAYARLRFIPDPTTPGQSEAGVELPEDHLHDTVQVRRALDVLAGFTGTPDELWFCLWEGYSDAPVPPSVLGSLVHVPNRSFALLRGRSFDGWETISGSTPPAFVWPADRSWCVAADVDPHWAGIGASREAIGALLGDDVLDVCLADPSQEPPAYR